jgi:hypothetical protein
MMVNAQRGQAMNQAQAQHTQNFNFFQPNYSYYQPQPAAYGYSPYAPLGMSYMGYSPYNPMASFAYGGYGAIPAPQAHVAAPVVIPQQNYRPQQSQGHIHQGVSNQPQNNPVSSFLNNVPSPQSQPYGYNANVPQQGINYNPFNQNANNPIYPQPNNNPAFNPFNNQNNPYNGGNNHQGRRW